jgi:tetratricopeptide (TPR) repeat protein
MTAKVLIKYTILALLAGCCVLQPQLAFCAERSKLVHQAAVLRVNRHNYKGSVALLLSATERDRQDPAYDNELACSLLSDGQNDRCIEHCTKVLEKSPRNLVLYKCRAIGYKAKGAIQKSIADFSKLIELSPMDPANYSDRAALYKMLGQSPLAQKDITRASNIQRYSMLALDDKSLEMTVLVKAGHFQEAERILPQYLAGEPQKIFYLSDIAKGFVLGERSDAAIKCAVRYLQLAASAKSSDPLQGMRAADETAMRELLVSQYLKQKNAAQAFAVSNEGIAQLEPLAKKSADDSGAQTGRATINLSRMLTARAEVYLAIGKRDSARQDLERALSLAPDSLHAAELLKKIKSKAI